MASRADTGESCVRFERKAIPRRLKQIQLTIVSLGPE